MSFVADKGGVDGVKSISSGTWESLEKLSKGEVGEGETVTIFILC